MAVASDLGRLSVGEGWSEPEGTYRWAQRQDARIFLPLEAGRAYRLTLRAMAPRDGQRITASLNGSPVGSASLAAAWQPVTFDLPAGAVRAGINELTFAYDLALPLLAGQPIGKTGAVAPVNIVVRSAGQEAGDYAHIYVDGRDVTANRRGYNLAVIDPRTGAVEQTAAFDTFADAKESNRMAELINRLPAGRIVALAVRDEASMNLQQDAVDALASLGATRGPARQVPLGTGHHRRPRRRRRARPWRPPDATRRCRSTWAATPPPPRSASPWRASRQPRSPNRPVRPQCLLRCHSVPFRGRVPRPRTAGACTRQGACALQGVPPAPVASRPVPFHGQLPRSGAGSPRPYARRYTPTPHLSEGAECSLAARPSSSPSVSSAPSMVPGPSGPTSLTAATWRGRRSADSLRNAQSSRPKGGRQDTTATDDRRPGWTAPDAAPPPTAARGRSRPCPARSASHW